MKSKVILMFLLTSVLSLAMISAATNFTVSKTSLNFINPDNSETFTITAVTSTGYTFITPIIADNDGVTIPITVTPPSPATANGTIPITITVNSTVNYDKLTIGKNYAGDLKIIDNNAEEATVGLKFTKTFCDSGEKGDVVNGRLELTDIKIDNNDGDDTEWSPLDPITIEVKVENTGDDKVSDVIVELGLYNSKGKNIVNDLKNLDDEQIKLGSIRDGDDDIATFNFKVPADFEDETYTLVIKAYSDDTGEDEVCTSYSTDLSKDYYELIDGVRETDEEKHIVVDNIKISPANPQCSEIVQVSAEVFNIGDEDYEDQVRVTLFNKELGINLEQTIRQDFDQGDSDTVDFEFEIPANAVKRTYILEFRTYYDYDTDDENYNLISDKKFTQPLTIEGNCEVAIPASSIKITAKLSSDTPDAIAGEQVIIIAKLENTGESTDLYTISVSGNTAWSSLSQIDPESVIISAGESKEVEITLVLDTAAEGDKEFTIKATKDGKTTEQKVALSITKKSTSGITGSAITDHIKANGFIYIIVLINLILIIAIILVIRRMLSPKSSI
jgi:uncharacterized membrane protein